MGTLRTLALTAALAVLLSGAPSTMSPAPSAAMTVAEAAPRSADTAAESRDRAAIANDLKRAQEFLAAAQGRYTHLEGVTIEMGDTPSDEQAIAYYTEGQIIISPEHSASIADIVAHEVWHVIDWRDNGRIDWGESLPPSNSADYLISEAPAEQ